MPLANEYQSVIERRRNARISGFKTIAEVGFEGPWVTPIQKISGNLSGPMLIAKDWFDEPSIQSNRQVLTELGYLPKAPFNRVLDLALNMLGLTRADIYITQVFHFIPQERSANLPKKLVDYSFLEITRYELLGCRPITLGTHARDAARASDVEPIALPHPSRGKGTYQERATRIAQAIEDVM